jgi:endonuclease III
LRLPLDEARGLLLSIEGIGEKTADMILAALFGSKYFTVDSNILRVLRRLDVISMDADIYEARGSWSLTFSRIAGSSSMLPWLA